MKTEEQRIQDTVARVSGINLKSVVRVLRALEMTARTSGHDDLAREVTRVLMDSTNNGGEVAALDSKPSSGASVGCDKSFDAILALHSWKRVRAIQELIDCPFLAAAQVDEAMSTNA